MTFCLVAFYVSKWYGHWFCAFLCDSGGAKLLLCVKKKFLPNCCTPEAGALRKTCWTAEDSWEKKIRNFGTSNSRPSLFAGVWRCWQHKCGERGEEVCAAYDSMFLWTGRFPHNITLGISHRQSTPPLPPLELVGGIWSSGDAWLSSH